MKKLIYISPEINAVIENICNENKIIVLNKFINEYNFIRLLQEDLKVLNKLDFLVIDIRAIISCNSEEEIIKCISQIRGMYDCRIIFIAQGYLKGDMILSKLFTKGVYNILTSKNEIVFSDEFKKAVSENGMSFAYAQKFEVETQISKGKSSIIKENYIKVKQDITIGVLGIDRHIGTTSQAISITKLLSSIDNNNACLIENNNHNTIINIKDLENSEYFENIGKISYNGIDMFTNINNIGEIKNLGYNCYIYDFGSFEELSDNDISNFLNKDIKIVVTGSKIWEQTKLLEFFNKIKLRPDTFDENLYFLFNFTEESKQEEIKSDMDNLKGQVSFGEYECNCFKISNKYFYEKIFKKLLYNTNFESVEKKQGFKMKFKSLFRKG